MQTLFLRVKSFFLALVLSAMAVFGAGKAGAPYAAAEPDSVQLCAAVVSDLHANGWTPHVRNRRLMDLFSGIAKSETPLDAVVFPGDLTETAQQKEYMILSELLRRYPLSDVILPATGNHDIRGNMLTEDYPQNLEQYYAFCRNVGVETDTPYWSKTLNGYSFIVLGSDGEVKDCAYLSPAQLLWLEETLAQAQKSGKPVFLICHQPLAHTNNVDESWPVAGTLGEQSDAVEAILRRFAGAGLPIVYISGHLHDDFSAHSFETLTENLYCLNLPSAQYNDGKGVVIEAYADRVLIRARSFVSGEWLPEVYTVELSAQTAADAA